MRKLIRIIVVFIFWGSLFALIWLLVVQPYLQNRNNEKVKEIYYDIKNNEDCDIKKELHKINSEIIGWVSIPNTVIDYPVLQSKKDDSVFYLSHDYNKLYSRHGSIFLDINCDAENSKNLILHGHHMKDGTMFATLVKFGDLDFYKNHPFITFGSISKISNWKIISIFKVNTNLEKGKIFNYIRDCFKDNNDFLDYLYNIKIRSIIDIPVDANESDYLLTLSTCSYEFDGCRTVIVARKIRENESEFINVEEAKKALNPVMPEYLNKVHKLLY